MGIKSDLNLNPFTHKLKNFPSVVSSRETFFLLTFPPITQSSGERGWDGNMDIWLILLHMIGASVSVHNKYGNWMPVLWRDMFFQNALIIIFWTLVGIPAAMSAASRSKA
jgi:hypothetical protein